AALRAVLSGHPRPRRREAPRRDRLGRLAGESRVLAFRAQLRARELGELTALGADDPHPVLPRPRPARVALWRLRVAVVVRLADALHPRRGRPGDPRSLHRWLPDRRRLPVLRATRLPRSAAREPPELRPRRGHARSHTGRRNACARDRTLRTLRVSLRQ